MHKKVSWTGLREVEIDFTKIKIYKRTTIVIIYYFSFIQPGEHCSMEIIAKLA